MAVYVTRFQLLAQDLQWNDPALMAQFAAGLSEEVLDGLAQIEAPTTLPGLIQTCFRIYHRQEARKESRRLGAAPEKPPQWGPRSAAVQPSPPLPATQEGSDEPMQLGATQTKLAEEERLRRRAEGLCFKCGKKGHWARACRSRERAGKGAAGAERLGASPAAPQPSSLLGVTSGEGVLEPGVSTPPSPTHLLLPVVLRVGGGDGWTLSAVVDSGSTANFMCEEFARTHHVRTEALASPLPVQTIDGRPLLSGAVTRITEAVTLGAQGHRERLQFYLACIPQFPVVLGLPWLRKHNPLISWEDQRITFTSPYCRAHCLSDRPAPQVAAATAEPGGVDGGTMGKLPEEYTEFADVFDEREAERLPPHRPYDCAINLIPGAALPKAKLYSMSETELQALRKFLDENLRKGFIRPSNSPLGAPSFFLPKRDGSLRFVHDYSALNACMVKDAYPLPLISEMLERLGAAKIFTKLDLRGAYNLVRIREGDEWKTAFLTRYGAFEYRVMSFGLANAPAVFSRFMHDIFRDLLDQGLLVYLDDLLLFSSSPSAHRQLVQEVLRRLRAHGLYARLDKCEFHRTSLDFLGYRISVAGIQMDPMKVQAVVGWAVPRSKKDVQKFLGFVNFYRRFLPGFSGLTAVLTDLLKKEAQPFRWTEAADRVFRRLKALFTTQPLLQHVSFDKPFVVQADASDVAVGAVLLQPAGEGGDLRPCAFHSRKLSPAERNYTIWEKELLAIKSALEVWRHLLEGARFPVEVRTDHKNLEHLLSARAKSQRQVRWSQFFSRFNLKLSYIRALDNQQADALSRLPQYAEEREEGVPPPLLPLAAGAVGVGDGSWIAELRRAQAADAFVRDKIAELGLQEGGGSLSSFALRDGLLSHRRRWVVPPGTLRSQVLQQCHDAATAGHFGVNKTVDAVTREFWWPRVFADVRAYVRSCQTCQRAKHCSGRPTGLLHPLPTPAGPWALVSLDFITDLPESQGKTAILVVVDLFSKMAHFVPCDGLPSARETAELFVAHIFRLHGWPEGMVSDRGPQFTAQFWRELMVRLDVKLRLSTAHHPQTDGETERVNATLEQYLRCYVNYQQDDWVTFLPLAEFAYNNACHNSTRQTPFFVQGGFHPRAFPSSPGASEVPGVRAFLEERQAVHRVLREQLEQAKEAYKRAADARRQPGVPLAVGDWVWLSTRYFPMKGVCRKLAARRTGPFQIVGQVNPVAFKLALPPSLKIHPVFHRALLSPVVSEGPYRSYADPPPPILVDGEEEYEVEQILDSRYRGGEVQYLIHWKGYGVEDRTWEPLQNLHAPDLLQQFHCRYPHKPRPVEEPSGGGGGVEGGDGVIWEPYEAPTGGAAAPPEPEQEESLIRPAALSGQAAASQGHEHSSVDPPVPAELVGRSSPSEGEGTTELQDARLRRRLGRRTQSCPTRRSARLEKRRLERQEVRVELAEEGH